MNRLEKTKLKRKYRLYLWLAFSAIFISIFGFISLMVFDAPQSIRIMGGIIITVVLIAGFVSNVNADWTRRDLIRYKADIRDYRARRLFFICIDLIEAGKIREASDLYLTIPKEHGVRDYLFSVLIHEFNKSDDPELKERGARKMKELQECYGRDKISFYIK